MVVALAIGAVTHGLDEEGGARASSRLLPAVQDLMQRAGLSLQDLHAVAFARGPGAFTGLRCAASAAQGLAFGLRLPVLPIDSLLVVAEEARLQLDSVAQRSACIAVAMDARMGQIYAARYGWRDGAWHDQDGASLVEPEALAALWRDAPPTVVAGTALGVYAQRLALAPNVRCIATMVHAPAALASLARRAWHAGHAVHPREAQPLYVRDKVAFTTRERDDMRTPSRAP